MNYTLNTKYQDIQELMTEFNVDGLFRLDLGCGYYKPPGFIGIDNLVGAPTQVENIDNYPDILMDLNESEIPFSDESCLEIRSSHFLEHSNLDRIINESHRLLHPQGKFNFTVPYASSAEGMYPGHNIFLTEKWFQENINFQNKFTIVKASYKPSSYWKSLPIFYKALIPFSFARVFLFNACSEMTIESSPKK